MVTSFMFPGLSAVDPSAPMLLTVTAPVVFRVTLVDSPFAVPRISPPNSIAPLPPVMVRFAASARVTSPLEAAVKNLIALLAPWNSGFVPLIANAVALYVCVEEVLYSAPLKVTVPVVLGLPKATAPEPAAAEVPMFPPKVTPPVLVVASVELISRLVRAAAPAPS